MHWQSDYYDYLTQNDEKELRKDVRERKGNGHRLVPNTNNKATWYESENGDKILRSYYTDVLRLSNGRAYKMWEGYSVTTMNHINKFLSMNGCRGMNKYEWVMLKVGEGKDV